MCGFVILCSLIRVCCGFVSPLSFFCVRVFLWFVSRRVVLCLVCVCSVLSIFDAQQAVLGQLKRLVGFPGEHCAGERLRLGEPSAPAPVRPRRTGIIQVADSVPGRLCSAARVGTGIMQVADSKPRRRRPRRRLRPGRPHGRSRLRCDGSQSPRRHDHAGFALLLQHRGRSRLADRQTVIWPSRAATERSCDAVSAVTWPSRAATWRSWDAVSVDLSTPPRWRQLFQDVFEDLVVGGRRG